MAVRSDWLHTARARWLDWQGLEARNTSGSTGAAEDTSGRHWSLVLELVGRRLPDAGDELTSSRAETIPRVVGVVMRIPPETDRIDLLDL
jgi:hypothetical protein